MFFFFFLCWANLSNIWLVCSCFRFYTTYAVCAVCYLHGSWFGTPHSECSDFDAVISTNMNQWSIIDRVNATSLQHTIVMILNYKHYISTQRPKLIVTTTRCFLLPRFILFDWSGILDKHRQFDRSEQTKFVITRSKYNSNNNENNEW